MTNAVDIQETCKRNASLEDLYTECFANTNQTLKAAGNTSSALYGFLYASNTWAGRAIQHYASVQ